MPNELIPLREREFLSYALAAQRAVQENKFDLAEELLEKASGATNPLVLSIIEQVKSDLKRKLKEEDFKYEINALLQKAETSFYVE